MFSYQLMAIGGNQMSACLSEGASVQVSLFFKIMPALFLIPRNLSFFQLLLQLKQPVTKRPPTGRRQPKLSNCQPKTERKRTEVQMRRQLSGAAGNPLAGNQTDWNPQVCFLHKQVKTGLGEVGSSSSATLDNAWLPRCPPTSVLHFGRKACQTLTFCRTTGSLHKEKKYRILIVSFFKVNGIECFQILSLHFIFKWL